MEKANSPDRTKSGVSRRETLKYLGGTSLTLAGASTALGQVTAETSVPVERLTGTYNNPVSMNEIESVKQRVASQGDAAGRSKNEPTPASGFEVPDDARIIDYLVTIGPNGNPVEHADLAGDDSAVTRERGREQMSQLESRLKTTGADGDVGTQANVGTEWNRVLSNSYTYRKDPYGEAFTGYVWWRLNAAEEPDGRAIHSVQHHGAMTPGTKIYNSNWHNEWLEADTFWNRDYPNQKVETWDPSSPADKGSIGVSVGYPAGASLSWTFESAGCIDPAFNSADPSVHWDLNCVFGNDNRRENTISIKPGSRAQMDDTPNNCHDGLHRVCELSSRGHFENTLTQSHWLRQNAWFGYNC